MSGYFVLNKCLGSINFDPDPGSALEKMDPDPGHEHFFRTYWIFFVTAGFSFIIFPFFAYFYA